MDTADNHPKDHARGDDAEGFPRPFGNYILLMNFARGGMGEVYLAKRGAILGAEKYCVLKKLRPELTEDREYVARFIDEARVVVQLNHANICQVFDVGRVGSEYYLVMEYVSGRDVRSVQDRARSYGMRMHEASVLHLLAETLSALDYAHRRTHPMTGEPLNLVHRDVSPQNIMVSFEGEVKLIDFGLASSRLKVERTQPNIVMGKMAYMAPEQARGDPIDKRTDLFAAGVIGYELLSGERFYEGMSSQQIWYVVGRGGFVPSKWDELNPDLARILARALHPEPESRFSSCAELRDALMAYLHTKHPGLGERSLRELVQELYADEIQRERDLLLGFADVSGEIEDLLESTRSQSVSLAHAGELSGAASKGGGARVVHDERTFAGGSLLDPTSTQLTLSASGLGSEERHEHEDPPPTLLDGDASAIGGPLDRTPPTGTLASGLMSDGDETLLSALPRPSRETGHVEQTAVVVRSTLNIPHTVAVPREEGGWMRLSLAAAAVLAVAIAAGFLIVSSGGDERRSESAPLTAAAAPPVEPTDAPAEVPPPVEVASDEGSSDDAVPTSPPPLPKRPAGEAKARVATPADPPAPSDDDDARAAEQAAEERAAEARRAREARRLAAAKAKEEREATRRAAERAAREREREARRAQTPRPAQRQKQTQQQRAPRESIEEMVSALMRCDLSAPCAKSSVASAMVKYKHGGMASDERRAFERLVRQCRERCPR